MISDKARPTAHLPEDRKNIMRKIILSAALAGSAIVLSACSQGTAEDQAEAEATAAADAETAALEVYNANTVTADQMATQLGIPPELSEAIIAGQPFASVTDFNALLMENLSEEQAAGVRETLFVPVDLNNATREELALIPGIDDKMIHEFEEYVPYADMAEFDREIGKYVDESEVARYRKYVTLGDAEGGDIAGDTAEAEPTA